tara:strand:+ start:999 stop:2105 length:1107 start_codon:yes stop_codon:yes gene_type:complete
MKKICHITTVHPRNDTRIFLKECMSLTKLYKVHLIVADGLGDEVKNNVHIYDIGLRQKSRLKRARIDSRKAFKKALKLNCELYHFHDPELITIGVKLKNRNYKVIYDIHEFTGKQILIKKWIPKILRKFISLIYSVYEKKYSKKMDALLVPQPIMFDYFKNINNCTVVVENFVITNHKKIPLKTKKFDSKIIFHPGGLTNERGVFNMINAMSLIDDDSLLILAGKINKDMLMKCEKIEGWSKVRYEGVLPHEEINNIYKKSTLGLILYNNIGQYHLSYSIKLFEYMLNGIPVIMPNFGEWIEFNNENNCGINVDPTNKKDVASAINYLNININIKKKLGENGRNAVFKKYNWGISEKKLLDIYKEILK